MQTAKILIPNQNEQTRISKRKKILFAAMPADGHFSPLTSLAKHLQNQGHDVRWYAGNCYATKLQKLGIPHFPFTKAREITAQNIDTCFPERKVLKGQLKKLKFDMIHYFINRAPEFYADIQDIQEQFPFDVFIADNCFAGAVFVKEKMNVPVVLIGVVPLTETSKDLGPAGMGLTPPSSIFQKVGYAMLKKVADKIIFGEPNSVMKKMLTNHGIDHGGFNLFDLLIQKCDLFLQSGTPGFEYYRSDLSKHVRFIGPVLPYTTTSHSGDFDWLKQKAKAYDKVILISQGTFEPDHSKLTIPAIEALKDENFLLIVTTAGNNTAALQKKYWQSNIVIEDFIPYTEIMPLADVFISNGGYGSVLLSIANELPLVVAGVHEGKNEINARVGYFKLGINLKNEKPQISAIASAVKTVLADDRYKVNVRQLAHEFKHYSSTHNCEKYMNDMIKKMSLQKILDAALS
jgi:UDP:flavonoid glycosyltransferase YjiC (YdhE family)